MRKLAITVSALAIAAASFGCKGRTDYNQPSGQGGGPQSGHQMGEDYAHPPSTTESTGSGTGTDGTGSTGSTGSSTESSGAEHNDRTIGGEGSSGSSDHGFGSGSGSGGIGGGPVAPSTPDNTRPGGEGHDSLGGKDAGGSMIGGGKDAGGGSTGDKSGY